MSYINTFKTQNNFEMLILEIFLCSILYKNIDIYLCVGFYFKCFVFIIFSYAEEFDFSFCSIQYSLFSG